MAEKRAALLIPAMIANGLVTSCLLCLCLCYMGENFLLQLLDI